MRDEKHKQGNRYNDEVKALLDKGVHETTEKFEDLPIIHTGCDTYASIYPEFKHFNKQATVDEVVGHYNNLKSLDAVDGLQPPFSAYSFMRVNLCLDLVNGDAGHIISPCEDLRPTSE